MNSAALPIAVGELSVVNAEPRIKDVRIGERLGMAQPLNIRKTIEANMAELERYGLVHAAREPYTSGTGRVAEATVYWLNEPQTLLLCMFSRTAAAADVRQEVIQVYLAYRRGGQPAPAVNSPWAGMVARQAVIRQTVAFHVETKAPEYAENLAHLLTVNMRNHRMPSFWSDVEVRRALINMHRQMTVDEARAALADRYGPDRTPSWSAIQRFWQRLDAARGAQDNREKLA